MKLRLDFLSADLSQHFRKYFVVLALRFLIHRVRSDSKSFVLQNQKSNFLKFNSP